MKVEVAARVRRLGTTSFHMDYEVRAGETVLVTATAVLVFVDADVRPTPIPQPWRETIAAFEELA